MTARESSTYSMLTCTVFDLHSIESHTGIGIGIGYWHWDRPILLGIGRVLNLPVILPGGNLPVIYQ